MSNIILDLLRKKDLSVAVVGATNDKTKFGNIIYKDLKSKGVNVVGINPRATTIDGDPCYKTIHQIKVRPDILNFVLPPKLGLEVIKEAVSLGYDNYWLQPGAESEEIIQFLKDNGKNYLAHACVMVELR
jgi:predicted CoA-binding protein